MTLKVLVLSISDRASKGIYPDKAGPAVKNVIKSHFKDAQIELKLVSDNPSEIETVLKEYSTGKHAFHYILTAGGTGIGPRDNTPEVTKKISDKTIPGIEEFLRHESLKETVNAVFSRGLAVLRKKTIIINFPGSEKGASFCADKILPIISHGIRMVEGKGH